MPLVLVACDPPLLEEGLRLVLGARGACIADGDGELPDVVVLGVAAHLPIAARRAIAWGARVVTLVPDGSVDSVCGAVFAG
jgi:hypothetical protein